MSSSVNIAQQTSATYADYKKLKTLVDVGFFLQNYIVEGGVVTKDVTYNNMIDVTEIVVSLDNDVTRRQATTFKTTIANVTYYLDYKAGDFTFSTSHPTGSFLPVAEVTTDSNKNVSAITDKRGIVGGFRLLSSYGLTGFKKVVSVLDYGADPTGTRDSSAAFQAAVDHVRPTGGTIDIPAGNYLIGTTIEINLDLHIPQYSSKGISIRGDNANTTIIINTSASDFAFHVFETYPAGDATASYFHLEDLTLTGTLTNKGLHMVGISEQYLEGLLFTNLFVGLQMEDVVRCRFVACNFSQNKNGLTANGQITISTPNAIDFIGTCFYGNSQSGCFFDEGCNINFFGGTIETNGHERLGPNTWGARFDNCGRYGGAGVNFYGTYFEGNGNVADVWINHVKYPATYSFHGCTFNKFAAPKDNINNIRVDAGTFPGNGAAAKVLVTGCAFRDFGHTPNSAERYIHFYTGGQSVVLEQYGNYFQEPIQMPDMSTNRTFASGRFVNMSTSPTLFRGFNIDNIFKNGTGDYTINFLIPSVNVAKITVPSMNLPGFARVYEETLSSIRILTTDPAGIAIDPNILMFISLE